MSDLIVGVELYKRYPGEGTLRASTAGRLDVIWPWVLEKIGEGMRVDYWRILHPMPRFKYPTRGA